MSSDDGSLIGYCLDSAVNCSGVTDCSLSMKSFQKERPEYSKLSNISCSNLRKDDCFWMMNKFGACRFDKDNEKTKTNTDSQGNAPDPNPKDLIKCGKNSFYVQSPLKPELCHCIGTGVTNDGIPGENGGGTGVSCDAENPINSCRSGFDPTDVGYSYDKDRPWLQKYHCKPSVISISIISIYLIILLIAILLRVKTGSSKMIIASVFLLFPVIGWFFI